MDARTALIWVGFLAFIAALVWLDAGLRGRLPRALTRHESFGLTLVWITIAVAFSGVIFVLYKWPATGLREAGGMGAREAAFQYLSALFVEQTLSLDNIFLIAATFSAFGTPRALQRRVVFWGALGAVALRAALIVLGWGLLGLTAWMHFVFAGLLFLASLKLLVMRTDRLDAERLWIVRLVRKRAPIAPAERVADPRAFTARIDGRLVLTPLAVVLVAVESIDVLSGLDSIPAVFAVTPDPFLALTSNVFAMLVLRHLYFAVVDRLWKFRYLKFALSLMLAYFGVKMAFLRSSPIPAEVSLSIIAAIITAGLIASYLDDRRGRTADEAPLGPDVERVARLTVRQAWKAIILVIGGTLLLLSPAVGMLPGPGGIFVFFLGLLILATEFVWAAQMLRYARDPVEARRQAEIILDRPGWRWALPALRIADFCAGLAVRVWNFTLGRRFGKWEWAPHKARSAAPPAPNEQRPGGTAA